MISDGDRKFQTEETARKDEKLQRSEQQREGE